MGATHQRSTGYRSGTRDLFSKKFRTKGNASLAVYMRRYKVGDMVDIVCDASQQKGMPHKFYHGRTGRVWNVNKRAIGVEVNKVHREKQIVKRIHVRVEHTRPSKSQSGHLARVAENDRLKKEAKETGVRVPAEQLKRQPKGPREGFELNMGATFEKKTHLLTPVPYIFKPLERILDI